MKAMVSWVLACMSPSVPEAVHVCTHPAPLLTYMYLMLTIVVPRFVNVIWLCPVWKLMLLILTFSPTYMEETGLNPIRAYPSSKSNPLMVTQYSWLVRLLKANVHV